ncbi:MAG: leucine-rich repeat domain-containing protein, partial [Clostridia bacterium]|nr:leucine-rich repeat domain-containing protein [Clostridia bacterium]
MKKFKYISAAIILVLCFGVISVGIYAAHLSTSPIDGSLVIGSINQPVSMSVYIDSTNSSPIVTYNEIRTSKEINLGNALSFNVTNAKKPSDVPAKKLIVRITNLSTETQVGAYFLTQELSSSSLIQTSNNLYYSDNASLVHSNVTLPSYTILNANNADSSETSATQELEIEFNMATWQEGSSSFKYYLYLEEYASNKTTIYEETTNSVIVAPAQSQAQTVSTLSSVSPLVNTSVFTNTTISSTDTQSLNFSTYPNVVIPEGVETIGASTFTNKTAITSVTLPQSLNQISTGTSTTGAFKGCTGLTSVDITSEIIGDYAFSGCTNLKTLKISKNATSIGTYAFSGASQLKSLSLPATVTSIGASAFQGLTSLTSVHTSSLEAWLNITFGGPAFSTAYALHINNVALNEFVIPDNLTQINAYNFYYCTSITSVKIPQNLTAINTEAFHYCSNLATVYNNSSLEIVKGQTTHGYVAYYANSVISYITEGNVVYDIAGNQKIAIRAVSNDVTTITLAQDCTGVAANAFQNITTLSSVT